MSNSIKVRTELRGNDATVRMLIRHPMEIGGRRKNGEYIAPHFITHVSCKHNGLTVAQAHWGPGISKNPYLSFVIGGANSGDKIEVRWVDNQGATDEYGTKI